MGTVSNPLFWLHFQPWTVVQTCIFSGGGGRQVVGDSLYVLNIACLAVFSALVYQAFGCVLEVFSVRHIAAAFSR